MNSLYEPRSASKNPLKNIWGPGMTQSAAAIGREVSAIIRSGSIASHKDFLLELLSHHPNPDKVMGMTDVRLNRDRTGFEIGFENGGWDTIAWRKCASRKAGGKRPSHRDTCMEAMRNEVKGQTMAFRRDMGYEGLGRDFHVGHDHDKGESFVRLAERFVAERCGGKWEGLGVVKASERTSQGNLPWILEGKKGEEWREFHRSEAILRMERAEDNLRNVSRCESLREDGGQDGGHDHHSDPGDERAPEPGRDL